MFCKITTITWSLYVVLQRTGAKYTKTIQHTCKAIVLFSGVLVAVVVVF